MGKYTIIEAPTFTVENTEPYMGELELKVNNDYTGFSGNHLIANFGELQRDGKANINLVFKNKLSFKDIDIIAISATCGCTTPTFRKEANGAYLVSIGVALKNMSIGDNSKFVKITMSDKRIIKIEIKVHGL